MPEATIKNARIVLANEVVEGAVHIRDGLIADVSTGPSAVNSAEDFEGSYLMPGLVELHTDNLERHMMPRPNAYWPSVSAVVAHDGEIAAAGFTTVFDALSLGDVDKSSQRITRLGEMADSIESARRDGLLRIDHRLHLRCEVSYPALEIILDRMIVSPLVNLVSVMDHSPGQRQFATVEQYSDYYMRKYGLDDAEMKLFILQRLEDRDRHSEVNRRYTVQRAQARGLCLASHDDATEDHVREAVADGMAIAEFPTTVAAAKASHDSGMKVLMGGPNVVRGGSHSGNVAASELAALGLLDIVSSDYVPASLLQAAFLLAETTDSFSLPRAIATVTHTPARSVGLDDRGEIAPGLRADLIKVSANGAQPVVRSVWCGGSRVA